MTWDTPPRFRGSIKEWADEVTAYLTKAAESRDLNPDFIAPFLLHQRGAMKALVDGQVMYNPTYGAPVFAQGGKWLPVAPVQGFAPAATEYFDNSATGHSGGTVTGVANRMEISLWRCPADLSYDQVGVAVSTLIAGAQVKAVAYNAGPDLRPTSLIFETAALDAASTGFKSVSLSGNFVAGKFYWLGVRHSSTAAIQGVPVAATLSLGLYNGPTATSMRNALRRSLTFATAAPATWGYVASELIAAGTVPSVRFRVV